MNALNRLASNTAGFWPNLIWQAEVFALKRLQTETAAGLDALLRASFDLACIQARLLVPTAHFVSLNYASQSQIDLFKGQL